MSLYDAQHLRDRSRMELVVRELLALVPSDVTPLYHLAKLEEDEGLIEAGEATLLDARRQQPDAAEPFKMLAQFYARRATALAAKEKPPEPLKTPGAPDEHGFISSVAE